MFPKILDIEQNTDEWYRARCGIATASEFKNIVTTRGEFSASMGGYALTLAAEKLMTDPPESFDSYHMIRGRELEPDAITAYEQYTFNAVVRVGFITCGDFGYSPDGIIGDDGLIEVKCPQHNTHAKYLLDGKVPTEYILQVQGGLYVSGRQWCDFVSYHPEFIESKQLFIKRAYRDEGLIQRLAEGIQKTIKKRDEILSKIYAND